MSVPHGLLERGREQAVIDDAVDELGGGGPTLVVVRGPAGIGKTTLLDLARARGAEAGMQVLDARGGALERDLVYGVIRQLLERRVFASGDGERERLLAGPARLAVPALRLSATGDGDGAAGVGAGDEGTLHHGLFRLVAALAESAPQLLLVDDAHWADTASLGFLLYLVRRLAGLDVLAVLAARSDEPPADTTLLDQLEALEEAADVASSCGAPAVAERARSELVVLGARPRRLRINGVDALTPSERRVAELAASGLSNREIAQELFVTLKTVETHLRQAYRKFDIGGRAALPEALAA